MNQKWDRLRNCSRSLKTHQKTQTFFFKLWVCCYVKKIVWLVLSTHDPKHVFCCGLNFSHTHCVAPNMWCTHTTPTSSECTHITFFVSMDFVNKCNGWSGGWWVGGRCITTPTVSKTWEVKWVHPHDLFKNCGFCHQVQWVVWWVLSGWSVHSHPVP